MRACALRCHTTLRQRAPCCAADVPSDPTPDYWYIANKVARRTLSPILKLSFNVAVKWLYLGRISAGKRSNGQWGLLRSWMMDKVRASWAVPFCSARCSSMIIREHLNS